MNILILGAGPCGLGAAYHLNKLGHTNWQLYAWGDVVDRILRQGSEPTLNGTTS